MLNCSECHASAETFELGWVSFYAQLPEEDPEPVLLTYCARCAQREAGSMLSFLTKKQTEAADQPPR